MNIRVLKRASIYEQPTRNSYQHAWSLNVSDSQQYAQDVRIASLDKGQLKGYLGGMSNAMSVRHMAA